MRTDRRIRGAALLLILLIGVALGPGRASGDMLLQQVVRTEPYKMLADEAPAPVDTVTIWLGEDRAAITGSGTNAILHRDAAKLYLLNRGARTYSVVDLPCDLETFFPPGHAQHRPFQRVLEAVQTEVEITPTEETREINGWPTRLFRIEMRAARASIHSETWATTAVPIDEGLYRELLTSIMSTHPATYQMTSTLDEIEGITVLDEQRISRPHMEMVSIRELIRVEEAEPPPGIYSPPPDYEERPFNPGRLR
ncbi:MAG: hypothetical protein GF330_04280 [Candidatus Eisenbacteria bacterium]|nr:hypothetical protein [Candidatus Eisenbacteria bacterium]